MFEHAPLKPSSSRTESQPATLSPEGLAVYKRAFSGPSPTATPAVDVVSASKMASAASAPFTPPKLPHPSRVCSEYRLLAELEGMHETSKSLEASSTTSLEHDSVRAKQLFREQLEKIREGAERTKENGFWSLLQKIGECLLAALGTVLGITLVATGAGAVVGGVMIAAGLLTITNFAMRETGSWDFVAKQLSSEKKRQDDIKFYLPLAVSIVSGLLSVGGSISAIWSGLNVAQQAMTIAYAALGVFQGVTTIGKGVTQARITWTQGDLKEIETRSSLERLASERDTSILSYILKRIESAQQTAEQIISLATQEFRKTVIQG